MPVNFMPSGDEYLRILPELILTVIGHVVHDHRRAVGREQPRKGVIFGNLTLATWSRRWRRPFMPTVTRAKLFPIC